MAGSKTVVTAREFNDIITNLSSSDIRVFKNNYATSGTYTVNASSLFGDVSKYNSFEAYMVLSGTFSASHWGKIQQTYQELTKVIQPSKGVFQVTTRATTGGWGTGGQSALYYDLIIIGQIKENVKLVDRGSIVDQTPIEDKTKLGSSPSKPAKSPNHILASDPYASDGLYWLKPDGITEPFQMWCKFDNDGAWMLVWSNLRGKTGRPTTNMGWAMATYGFKPIYNIPSSVLGLSDNKELWEVYTPLNLWNFLMGNKQGRLQYEWRSNYGGAINKKLICSINPFTGADNYTLHLSNCKMGADAGLWNYHNGRPLTTTNLDNDAYVSNCADLYSGTPWWYGACWSGSINGGGEHSGQGYMNGAYWNSSHRYWGTASNGYGAGNGFIYIQLT